MGEIHDFYSTAEQPNSIQSCLSPIIPSGPSGKELSDFYAPLVSNKRNRETVASLPNKEKAEALTVDQQPGDNPARSVQLTAGTLKLEPFAVTVVS